MDVVCQLKWDSGLIAFVEKVRLKNGFKCMIFRDILRTDCKPV